MPSLLLPQRLSEGAEDAAKVMAKVCRSLSGDKFHEAALTCKEHQSQEYQGCLDVQGLVAVMEEVSLLSSSGDKVSLQSFHTLYKF